MYFEFLKIRILCFYLFFNILDNVETSNKKWLGQLMKHIRGDKEINQVTWIIENDRKNLNSATQELSTQISKVISTRKLDFEEARIEEAERENQLQQFYDPRATLFLMIPAESDDYLSRLTGPINFINLVCRARRRPKVLIISQVRNSANYQKLFQIMWSKQFLDVSVLELFQDNITTSINFNQKKTVDVKLHYYLPFTDSYIRKNYPSKELFPEKLRTLNNYEMKVGIFHYPPYVFLTRNSTGEIVNYHGPDIEAINTLSKALNFKISEKFSDRAGWDKASCIKEGNNGLIHNIAYNEINVIAVQSSILSSCMIDIYEQSSGIRPFYYYVAIAPTVQKQPDFLLTDWKIYNAGIVIILLMIIWIISRILRFNNRNWKMEDILRVILGWTIPREPETLAERIVLGSMLITCFLYSSFIFTAFTTINLQKEPNSKTGIVEALIESGVETLIDPNILDMLVSENHKQLDGLLKKAVRSFFTDDECVEYLIKFKNITCVMRDTRVHLVVENKRKEYGESVIRSVEEFKVIFPTSLILEKASPYVQRFDALLFRIRESGIVEKWDEKFINYGNERLDSVDLLIAEFIESTKIQRQIFLLLVFGYSCSFVVFIAEVLFHLYQKIM